MLDTTQSKEFLGQATRAFEAAVQSGIRLQEESVKFLTEVFQEMGSPEKWQKTTQSILTGVLSASQQTMEEAVQVMNENAKTSVELLQKACQNPPADVEEAQCKTMALWESALQTLRRNTEVLLKSNSRLVEAWTDMVKKSGGKHLERMAQMAQKATQEAQEAIQRAAKEATHHGVA